MKPKTASFATLKAGRHSLRPSIKLRYRHIRVARLSAEVKVIDFSTTLQCRLDGTEFLTTRLATAAAAAAAAVADLVNSQTSFLDCILAGSSTDLPVGAQEMIDG